MEQHGIACDNHSDQRPHSQARPARRFAFTEVSIDAKRPVAAERRAGIASKRSLLIACGDPTHSFLSIFQKIGVAGPSSTPVSDLRQALGAKYCPSGT